MSNKLPAGRPVKEVYRHVIRTEWFRPFTLIERLRILFGYNLLVYIRVPCRHNPHTFQPIVGATTTKHMTPDAHLTDLLEQAVRDTGEFSPDQSDGQTDK